MTRVGSAMVMLLLLGVVAMGCRGSAPTPTFTSPPTSTPTPTMRLLPTATPTYTPQPTLTRVAPTPTPTPTPTPEPMPTRLPTPMPSPTPVNPGTTVTVGSAELSVGSSSLVPLTAWRITDPQGLAAYEIMVKYDPRGVKVEEVQPPQLFQESQTGATLVSGIVPEKGEVYLVAFHTEIPGPVGDVELAYLSLTGLKAGVWPIEVHIDVLANSDGQPIPAAGLAGVVTVR